MVAFFSEGEPSEGLKLGNIQETLEAMDLADSNDTHAHTHDEDEHMNETSGVTETTGEGQDVHEGEEEEHEHAHVDVIAEKVQTSRFFGIFSIFLRFYRLVSQRNHMVWPSVEPPRRDGPR